MNIRRLFALFALILVGGILVACGTDDDDVSPTAAPTEVAEVEPTATEETDTEVVDDASPAASPMATPAIEIATPASEVATPITDVATPIEDVATPITDVATPIEDVATPIADVATPVVDAATVAVTEEVSDDATPDADSVVSPLLVTADEEEAAEADSTSVSMVSIAGTLTLDGRVQQDFTLSEEGCVGLGDWRQLKPGSQVIVRDAAGTVVNISTLEERDSGDECSWAFSIEVPDAEFFSISIPMVTEVWFDQNDPAVESGELELFVP